jgi:predicted esterase
VSVRAILCSIALCACGAASTGAPASPQLNLGLRHVEVATDSIERAGLAEIPSIAADRVALAVAFPAAFAPEQVHPILVTQVTADRARPNLAELAAYAPTALEQGYVVISAQGIPWPERHQDDTLVHRYATLRAALRWLAGEVPQSERWPIVLAGFSGGAKISQVLAFSLMLEHRHVAGVFLGGCNEDHSQVLLGEYPAVKDRFSQIAYYLSVGEDDRISPPASVRDVAKHLRASGAQRVEVSTHGGGHRLDTRDLSQALRWFRAQL